MTPESDGVIPESDGVMPESDGVIPESDVISESDGVMPESDVISESDGVTPESDSVMLESDAFSLRFIKELWAALTEGCIKNVTDDRCKLGVALVRKDINNSQGTNGCHRFDLVMRTQE
ncbi:hypothetical protein PoB_004267600 [Plakobranchus ocellatus]|uniref:Uncharacterized protein n=1 Tax=Plakobranchus ocellatus TaxID=259542 RepID=A0AAV4BBF1_9GAST|nr:hypothetical protein PoB_004267600 [Plakobranchus ocellatus]